MKNILILLVSLLGLTACAATTVNNTNQGSYKPVSRDTVATEKWYLTSINNASYHGPRINMNLSSQQRVNGFSGCNRFFASVTELDMTRLRFGSVGSTKMLCTDRNSNQLERTFLTALRGVTHYQKNDQRLVLNGATKLVFMKKTMR
ncbi:MAG: META domain-containing protein [Cocleimonas sp.]|nr:META domain-containing protein [Cocleimonas sp.]